MKNNIEDFIKTNRMAFDDQEPPAQVWTRIRASLNIKVSWINAMPFWRAAAVLFMAITAFLVTQRFVDNRSHAGVISEFQDVETFYLNQIATKIELIEDNSDAEGAFNGFTHDFQHLDAMYQVLKEELKNRPTKQVKDALVLNLLIRIDLLNQQLHKLEKPQGSDEEERRAAV
ncbi:hypothetical protein QQ054_06710 [Oscillatoria amoena NRMC-F 0135]|nr:hypothetical protein [Oscillatoria amoena NRMC-F 0135]